MLRDKSMPMTETANEHCTKLNSSLWKEPHLKVYMHRSEVKVLILVVTGNHITLTIQNWNTRLDLNAWRQILKRKAMLI